MEKQNPAFRWLLPILGLLAVVGLTALGMVIEYTWGQAIRQAVGISKPEEEKKDDAHADPDSLKLSPQARRNVGLTDDKLWPITATTFTRKISVPARVVERPARSLIHVPAPMTCVVEAVHVLQGEAVRPGQKLFTIRLTHEDLLQAQTTYLKTLGELDVELREIARIKGLEKQGVVAGKTLYQREYARDKLKAALQAQRESLILHGLPKDEVDKIPQRRRSAEKKGNTPGAARGMEVLIHTLDVVVPQPRAETTHTVGTAYGIRTVILQNEKDKPDANTAPPSLVVQRIDIQPGSFVSAGSDLCVLADLSTLYIEGRAFEQDADELARAKERGWKVEALIESDDRGPETIPDLDLVYVRNDVESESRALHFYVALPNQASKPSTSPAGHRFVTWKHRPGQRMQLRVPVEQWSNRIVLPVEAVAQSGAENYVFQQNGDMFRRRAVHVEYRDQYQVVIANDGSLFPGDTVALTGAHQMLMALKNKESGGGGGHHGHVH